MAKTVHLSSSSVGYNVGSGNTEYVAITLGYLPTATYQNREMTIQAAGVFSNMQVYMSANPATSAATTALWVNQTDTGLSVSIPGSTTGRFDNTSTTVTVSAGDVVAWRITAATISVGTVWRYHRILFDADTDNYERLVSMPASTYSSASTTWYHHPGGAIGASTVETSVRTRIRTTTTLKNLYVYVSSNARTTTTTVRSRKNAANGAMSVSITSTATGTFEDTTNTDSLVSGDYFNYSITTGSGTQSLKFELIGSALQSTDNKHVFILGGPPTLASASISRYTTPSGRFELTESTEANVQTQLGIAGTASNLGVHLSVNGRSTATTVGWRKNGATVFSTSVTGNTTGLFENTASTDDFTETDNHNFIFTTGSGAGSQTLTEVHIHVEETAVVATGDPKVRISGSFVKKPSKVRISGVFVEKPTKVKVSGTWKTLA